MSDSTHPAGWYPDGTGQERYWDGHAWNDIVRPAGTLFGYERSTTHIGTWPNWAVAVFVCAILAVSGIVALLAK